MNSSPKLVEFAPGVWPALIEDLRRRGRGVRESGAFLLGRERGGVRIVTQWLPYEQLDPAALNFEYVRLESAAFGRLWDACAARGLEPVADVHTHPFGPRQSESDRGHPMISLAGHVALIVPRFAQGRILPVDVSVNVYLGGGRWESHYELEAQARITLL
jgi:proteasome lid subunit RPN8/RPN11